MHVASAYITPKELAMRLKVKTSTVLSWIHSGELNAVNVGRRGAKRPRFRISPEAVSTWESTRSTGKVRSPVPAPVRRRKAESSVASFY